MASPRELKMRKLRPQSQNSQSIFAQPMQGGVNAIASAGNVPETDAIFLYNMVPQEYGVAVRRGYREWCQPIPLGDGVRSIIPFSIQKAAVDPADKLFAATSDGIYDITLPGSAPVKVLDWPIKTVGAGYVSWHAYTTIAGQFLLVCDLSNGYYVYTASSNTWAVGAITGPTPAEALLDFVTVWKNRVWFIERDSGRAWYLPVGAITGNATAFDFGNKFKYGGWLKSLWNWTLDGGEGVDDYLVALSSAGDVVVYKGTDPASPATFNQVGWWFLGRSVLGRRQASDMGGELLVLSTYGLTQMSKVISGMPATDEEASVSWKINPRMNRTMREQWDQIGWDVKLYPHGQIIVVTTPKAVSQPWMQFVYHTGTRAWSQFLGVPMNCMEEYGGRFYFGTSAAEGNRVFTYAGFSDNVLLENDGETATAIEWEMLSGYQRYTEGPDFKRVHFLRPQFIGPAKPVFGIKASYDFDLQAIAGSPPFADPLTGLWNTGIWDNAFWGGSYIVDQPPRGASGLGRNIAIAMKGRSAVETIHVGTDIILDKGGML